MDGNFQFEDGLQIRAFAQEDLEESVALKAHQAMLEKEREVDLRLIKRETDDTVKISEHIKKLRKTAGTTGGERVSQVEADIRQLQSEYEEHQANISNIAKRIATRESKEASRPLLRAGGSRGKESHRDYLIRKGVINHFTHLDDHLDSQGHDLLDEPHKLSHQVLGNPGFELSDQLRIESPCKRQKLTSRDVQNINPESKSASRSMTHLKVSGFEGDYEDTLPVRRSTRQHMSLETTYRPYAADDEQNVELIHDSRSGSEYSTDDKSTSDLPQDISKRAVKPKAVGEEKLVQLDDGNEKVYQARLLEWTSRRKASRSNFGGTTGQDNEEEWFKPHPSINDYVFRDDFRLPGDITESLFDYQRTCVDWLWNLYSQKTGGIVGDEMGLGKTIQTIAFIAALHYSKKLHKPVIIVAPATVLRQWCNEFHRWWPPLRVSILHSTGSGMGRKMGLEQDLSDEALTFGRSEKSIAIARRVVRKVLMQGHVLVTTYAGLSTYGDLLLPIQWECAVLDEGHRIRNPDAAVSLTAKQLKSQTRIILSGTPIQNNLTELWSLFDFVYPGLLGVLPIFKTEIAHPIKLGGYVNASNLQVHAGNKCATVLRNITRPYIIRRFKQDVTTLPEKRDQVLFCNLVQKQKEDYEDYLKSSEVSAIFEGKRELLAGIDILRKICNHPDLVDRIALQNKEGHRYGHPSRSGKMQIVKGLLQAWNKDGSKCLIFSQGLQMLDILEAFVKSLNIPYRRMDGTTPISSRQTMVDSFNKNDTIKVFLLTTKVGGLGVNLTGATRIIIYDPDWNPSNDLQARERSWRLGQTKQVQIYRLLVRGTIEEKIYQRQLFKQFLTKKVLEDPQQRRVFKLEDMHDLFTLGTLENGSTETGQMFEGMERQIEKQKEVETNETRILTAIPGVSRVEKYLIKDHQGEDQESKTAPTTNPQVQKEKDNLETMLARAGVHSIFEHDDAIDQVRSDNTIVEREASRIAQHAVEALQQSSRVAQMAQLGTVTWTGRSGSAGKVEVKSQIPGSNRSNGNGSFVKNRIASQLVAFIKDRGGQVTSVQITDHFNRLLPANSTSEFRDTLKSVADFDREAKTWTIKVERHEPEDD